MASRSTVTVSAAIHHASLNLREKAFAIAANLLECAPADLELREGGVGVVGVPGAVVSLARLAQAARPGWDHGRPSGIAAGLEETYYWEPPTVTWSYAAHVAIVEVDKETGRLKIETYVVVHDCGVVVNPMLVEGQVMGGTAQGLGGVLCEAIAYDAGGQLLSATLMDYALPTASDIPAIQVIHQHSPSPLNPLGVKGVGEGGAVAPPVAIANAVCDALSPFGIELNATPIRPSEIVGATRRVASSI
jgi:aerobic carbon-monoxide dehydrogenase large subunit